MVAPEAVASEIVAASSSSTGLYDFFPTARATFTGIELKRINDYDVQTKTNIILFVMPAKLFLWN